MKYLTREQLRGRKKKAVRFVRDVVGDPWRADEIERESLDDYARRRGIELLDRKGLVESLRDFWGSLERVEEIGLEDFDDYAPAAPIQLPNPPPQRRSKTMADTKASLQRELDEAREALQSIYSKADEALDAELTREEVVAAVKEISDLAEPFAEEEDEDESGDEE